MTLKRTLLIAGTFIAGIVAGSVKGSAQGPLYDKVVVDLPYSVTINDTVLQPGNYVIRQMDDGGSGNRVLMIFSDNGMKLKTTSLTIPALENKTPERTSVLLHRYGNDYYFNKVWIQGKNYGYEFPLPAAVKSRQREAMQPYTVAASFEPTAQKEEVAAAVPAPAPAPAAVPEPAPPPQQVAQNTPPPKPASPPTPPMPQTASNWLSLVVGGAMLAAAGMMLRKIRV